MLSNMWLLQVVNPDWSVRTKEWERLIAYQQVIIPDTLAGWLANGHLTEAAGVLALMREALNYHDAGRVSNIQYIAGRLPHYST